MTTFTYIAKQRDGSETRGTIDAASLDAAREELRNQGLDIDDIRNTPTQTRPSQQSSAAPFAPIMQPRPSVPRVDKPTPLPWSGANNGAAPRLPDEPTYAPLHETLRVFAGWLLAWYGLIYALGFLSQTNRLPSIPFIHELFVSPLVLSFTFGTFFLLALSNVHQWIHGKTITGFLLVLVYICALTGFVIYG